MTTRPTATTLVSSSCAHAITTTRSTATASHALPESSIAVNPTDDNESTLYEVMSSSSDDEFIVEEITVASCTKEDVHQHSTIDRTSTDEGFGEITVHSFDNDQDFAKTDQGPFRPNLDTTPKSSRKTIQSSQQQQQHLGPVDSPLKHSTLTVVGTNLPQGDEREKLVSTTTDSNQVVATGNQAPTQNDPSVADEEDESFFELTLPKLQPQVSGLSCMVDWPSSTADHVEQAAAMDSLLSPLPKQTQDEQPFTSSQNPSNKTAHTSEFFHTLNSPAGISTEAVAVPRTPPPPRQHSRPSFISPKEGFELRLHLQREISGLSMTGLESVQEEEEEDLVQEQDKKDAASDKATDWNPMDDPKVFAAAVVEAKKKSPIFRSPRRTVEHASQKRLSTIEEGSIHHASSLHRRTASPSPPRGSPAARKKQKKKITMQDIKRTHRQERRMAVESSLDRFSEHERESKAVDSSIPSTTSQTAPSPSNESSSMDESSFQEEEEEERGFELVLQPMVRQPSALTFCPFDLEDDDDDDGNLEESTPSHKPAVQASAKSIKTSKKDRDKKDKKAKKRSSKTSISSKPRRPSTSSKKTKRSSTVSASAIEEVSKPLSSTRPKRHSYSSALPTTSSSRHESNKAKKKSSSRRSSKSPKRNGNSRTTSPSRPSRSSVAVSRARSRSPILSRHRRHNKTASLSPPPPPRSKRESSSCKKGIKTTEAAQGQSKTSNVLVPSSRPPRNPTRNTFPNATAGNNLQALGLSDHHPAGKKRDPFWSKSSRRRKSSDNTPSSNKTHRGKERSGNQSDQILANLSDEVLHPKSVQKNKGRSKQGKHETKGKALVIPKRSSYPTFAMPSRDAAGWRKVVPRRSGNA